MAGIATNNGMPLVQPGTSGVTALTGLERVAADTELASGAVPQTVAPTSFQLGAAAAAMIYNSGTLSANTATVNARSGIILTGSLNTAAGSTYAFTIVNSVATTGQPVQLGLASGSNTTVGAAIQSSAINNSGTVSVTLVNNGTAALNGTMLIPFQVGASV
jgi:hypothetical protein